MCIPLILECFEALFDGTLITPPFVVEPSSLEIEEGPQIAPRAALEAVQIDGMKPIVSTDETSSAKGLEHRKSDFDHLQRDPVTSLDRDGDGSLDGYKKSDESASSITEAETDSEDELSFLSSESPCALDTVDRDGEISSLSENGKRLRFSNFDGNDCITIHEVPRLVEPNNTLRSLHLVGRTISFTCHSAL